MGTLRSEENDGSENITIKLSLFSFNLYLDYSNSLTVSNLGKFCWSLIPKHRWQNRGGQ